MGTNNQEYSVNKALAAGSRYRILIATAIGGSMDKILFIYTNDRPRAESVMTHLSSGPLMNSEDSAATSRENEIRRTTEEEETVRSGIPVVLHRSATLAFDYDKFDYLIAMDENNLRNMKRFVGSDEECGPPLLNMLAEVVMKRRTKTNQDSSSLVAGR